MKPKIHQVLATLGYGDAIGHEVLGIQRVLRSAGYESEIFVQTADPRLEEMTIDYRDLLQASDPSNILIHHFSIGSRASRIAYAVPDRQILVYHNITPPGFFVDVHEQLAEQCFKGRRELSIYPARVDLALGDSEFNRQELEALGFDPTGVLPVVPDFSHLDLEPNNLIASEFDDEWTNIIFVGRIIPNKRIEDVIRYFHAYQQTFNHRSRMIFVGSYGGYEKYLSMLQQLVATLGTSHVYFTGHVSDSELTAYYEVADLFLCASAHEGFCVPIAESFYKQVPVVAYAATAVPATMDGAGVLYATQEPLEVAALVDTVLSDARLYEQIVAKQDEALVRLQAKDFDGTLLRYVDQVLKTPRRAMPQVAWDFWDQFRLAEELYELQQVPAGDLPWASGVAGVEGWHRRGKASMKVNQWVPAAHKGDAIGDSARRVRDFLRAMGHESDIYALTIDDDLRHDIRPFSDPAASRGDVTIFHFALPSPMSAAFAALPHGRVLQYHNVTPARFFAPYAPPLFRLASLAREELSGLAAATDLALGDSEYNRQELEELGFTRTGVMPIAVDTGRLTKAQPQPVLEELLDDRFVNFLFVGRIAPNKKIEDHIKLAEQYKRYIDAHYRFIFVGRYDVVPRYYSAIRGLMTDLKLLPERFIFTGPVPDAELAAYYRASSVYISLSEHEGFCVPLVEAMAMDVPVLAYSAGAVPDTLGGAGVQFAPKDFEYAAELLGMLAFEESPREEVLAGQRRRLQDFGDGVIQQRLTSMMSAF